MMALLTSRMTSSACFLLILSVLACCARASDESSCFSGWSCVEAAACSQQLDAAYSCGDADGPLHICCPGSQGDKNDPAKVSDVTTMPRLDTTTTGSISGSSTAKPAGSSTPKVSAGTTRKPSTPKVSAGTTTRKPSTPEVSAGATTRKPSTPKLPAGTLPGLTQALLDKAAQLLPVECGYIDVDDRVIGGHQAKIDQFPWMALLMYKANGTDQFWCGGSIISKRYVLTAAHCVNVNGYSIAGVRLGEWNLTSTVDCQMSSSKDDKDCADPTVDVEAARVLAHPRFGARGLPALKNDIALVRLAKEVNFTDFIKPVCLSVNRQTELLLPSMLTVSGWGVLDNNSGKNSPVLQFANVPLLEQEECAALAPPETRPLDKTQFCAGGNGEDACRGDSGGPLTYTLTDGSKVYQKGVVSLSTSQQCGLEGRPTVYSEVSAFMPWILRTIQP